MSGQDPDANYRGKIRKYVAKAFQGRLWVLGTTHLSAACNAFIEELIRRERPDVVLVELEETRLRILEILLGETPPDPKDPAAADFLHQLADFRQSIGAKIEEWPSMEMMRAVRVCRDLCIPVQCMDLPFAKVLQVITQAPAEDRARLGVDTLWAALPPAGTDFMKLLVYFAQVNQMNDALRECSPAFLQSIMTTRERHMVATIQQVLQDPIYNKILACVGGGHVPHLLALLAGEVTAGSRSAPPRRSRRRRPRARG